MIVLTLLLVTSCSNKGEATPEESLDIAKRLQKIIEGRIAKMSLKLYEIDTTLQDHPDYLAGFKKIHSAGDIFLFFVLNQGDEEKIKRRNLEYVAGSGYTLKNIEKTDYISTSRGLLFSKRFVNKVGDILKKDMQFFPCQLICQDTNLDWYVARILRFMPIIDEELTEFKVLSGGEKLILFPKYREDITEPFYIARDIEHSTCFVVSDLFVDLCQENDILINFREDKDYNLIRG